MRKKWLALVSMLVPMKTDDTSPNNLAWHAAQSILYVREQNHT